MFTPIITVVEIIPAGDPDWIGDRRNIKGAAPNGSKKTMMSSRGSSRRLSP
jgi:hypothetical protein